MFYRRELPILAGAVRKNRHRENTSKRQKIGARFDGLIQDGGGRYEYAAIEGSKAFVSERNTKWLNDYHKVAKALHDMLYSLQSVVGNDAAVLEKLHLAGIVNAGKQSSDRWVCNVLIEVTGFRAALPGATNELCRWLCVSSQL